MVRETISEPVESNTRRQISVLKHVLISQALISFGERDTWSDAEHLFRQLSVFMPNDKMTKGWSPRASDITVPRFETMRTVVYRSSLRSRIAAENAL